MQENQEFQYNIACIAVSSRPEIGKLGQKAYGTLMIGELEALMKGRNRLTLVIDSTKIYPVFMICKPRLHSLSSYFPGKVEAL